MLLGIFWHTAIDGWLVGNPPSGAIGDVDQFFISGTHAFRLPVFFVMAGFFAALVCAKAGARAFAEARSRRIGIPLVAGVLTIVPLTNIMTRRTFDADVVFDMKPYHLWFLIFLLVYYVAALIIRAVASRGPALEAAARRVLGRLAKTPLRILVLVPLVALIQFPRSHWSDNLSGEFIPPAGPVLYYGVFFGFGWLLYAQRELLPDLRRGYAVFTLLAIAAAIVLTNALETGGQVEQPSGGERVVVVLATATVAWSAVFALLGWFHRWFGRPSPRVRYVADSAFWLYLAHFPLVAYLYVEFFKRDVPPVVSLVAVPVVVTAFLLVVYEYAVRYTFIGRVLHGPRARTSS